MLVVLGRCQEPTIKISYMAYGHGVKTTEEGTHQMEAEYVTIIVPMSPHKHRIGHYKGIREAHENQRS